MSSKIDYDVLQAAKAIACRNVLAPDFDYFLRKVRRWYSEKFHVPLTEIDRIPTYDLMLNYWEVFYEGLDNEHLIEESEKAVYSEEELKEIEEKDEEDFEKILKQVEKEEAEKRKAATPNKMVVGDMKDFNPVKKVVEEGLPPEISISFVDDGEFTDAEFAGMSVGPATRKK